MSNIQVTNIKNLSGNNTVAISSAGGDFIVKNDLIAEGAVEISGIITANSSGLSVSGVSTVTELVVNGGVTIASGIVTATSFSGSGFNLTGIVTATSFVGDGSNLTGIVTGIEAGGNITVLESPTGNFIITSTPEPITQFDGDLNILGVVTATSFNGSGSNLTGVLTSITITGADGITVSSVGTEYTISAGFSSIVDDTAPQLGGELDLNSNNITGIGTINIDGEITGTTLTGNLVAPNSVSVGNDISFVGLTGIVTATSFSGSGSNLTGIVTGIEAGDNITILESPTGNFIITSTTSITQLDGDLNLGTNDIIGTGNIDIIGLVSATSFNGSGSNLSGVVTSLLITGENGITVSSVGTAYTISSNFNSVADDSTPQLGGELDLNSNNITGIGTINIDGEITGTTLNGNLVAPSSLSVGNDISFTGLTGRITATSFVGDGSGLTGVIGSGSGVIIKENDVTVGTAGTINFGTGLDVSPISAGVVTVTSGIEIKNSGSPLGTGITGIDFSTNLTATASGGIATITASGGGGSGTGYFSNDQSNSGIHTTAAHVGLGTTNPSTSVQINDVYGIETESGTFTATAGAAYTANTYASSDFVTSEYTLFFQHSSGIQSQKVLIMDDETTAYSQEYGIMYSDDLLISVGATVSSGNVELWWTPESGVSGIVTYRFTRETMI